MIKQAFYIFITLVCSSTTLVYAQQGPCQQIISRKIVVLGSSTAAGTGPSTSDSAWVNRYRAHLQSINPNNEVVNLAVGGYNTYRIMPTGFAPPSNRPNPDVNKNISAALAESPDAIIINMPSNDVAAGFSYAEQMFNLDTIAQIANNNNIPIWICTTQPRNFSNTNSLQLQFDLKDSITSIYGSYSINFWSNIANSNHTINALYDSGDGVHLNDAGHAILAQRVIDLDILTTIYSPPIHVDYGIQSILVDVSSECGDSNTVIMVIAANYGMQDTISSFIYLSTEHASSGQNILDSIILNPIPSCEIDTFFFNINTYEMGNYDIVASAIADNDMNHQNDSLFKLTSTIGHPVVSNILDTLCMPGNGELTVPMQGSDTSFWYQSLSDSIPFYSGPAFQSQYIDTTTTWYVDNVRGDLFYRSHMETTTNSNVNWNGAMFNLVPQEDLILDSIGLKINTTGMQSVDIYYKQGSYIGSENAPIDWTLMTTSTMLITDSLNLTYYPLPLFSMTSTDTIGIYIQMSDPQSRLSYRSVSSPITRSNSELTIITGSGVGHNFVGNYFPRDLNCDLKYHFGSRPQGACSTGKYPATVFVSDFELYIGNDTIIDFEDSISLTVPVGLFNWFWDPTNFGDSLLTIHASQLGTGIHYIALNGYDNLGCFKTDEVVVGVAYLVGINDNHQPTSANLFPNPTSDWVFSNYPFQKVELYNSDGKLLSQDQQFPIDLSELPNGVYYFKIHNSEGELAYSRIVKR